ncbi:unnamed protein product [Sphagnum troendelagicum]|uniref:Uncharacterized protein n=1 Tax=Sphagnum troendelagicum TaxID=128251 RepID=A0ABP0TTA5_9BRYO
MPEIGHSGETSQPAQEALRLGQVVRMSTMPEVGQSDVETSQPVRFYSFSRVHSSSFPRRMIKLQVWGLRLSEVCIMLDVMVTAGTKLQSVSEKKSVEVELFEASKDSEWIDAIEKKNCKLLLQVFRSERSLWVQTGLKGRRVLHVPVMQGCSELVRELHYDESDLVPCGKTGRLHLSFCGKMPGMGD